MNVYTYLLALNHRLTRFKHALLRRRSIGPFFFERPSDASAMFRFRYIYIYIYIYVFGYISPTGSACLVAANYKRRGRFRFLCAHCVSKRNGNR